MDLKSSLQGRWSTVQLASTVVGKDDSTSTVVVGELGVLNGLDTLQDDWEGGEVPELLEVWPGLEGVCGVSGSNTVAESAVTVTVSCRVDSQDDGLGTRCLNALEVDGAFGEVATEIDLGLLVYASLARREKAYLLEVGLGAVSSVLNPQIGHLLHGQSGEEGWYVQDTSLSSSLHQTLFSSRVCEITSGSGTDEEGHGEVVSKEGSWES